VMMCTVLPPGPIIGDVNRAVRHWRASTVRQAMTFDQIVQAGGFDVVDPSASGGFRYVEPTVVRVSRDVARVLDGYPPAQQVPEAVSASPVGWTTDAPTYVPRHRALSSSLSRSGPPVPLRNVASLAACDDVQTVITR